MPSLELERYLEERAAGGSVADARFVSGFSEAEAKLTEKAIESGELSLPISTKEEPIMARDDKAENKDQIVEEILKPDFARAIKVLTHDVKPAEEHNAESRGDLSAAWKIIEDECRCNKAAAKAFNKLFNMSEEKRDDYLRTLYGLMAEAKIGISADLVDRMGDGEAPSMPVVERHGMGAENLATVQ